MNIILQNHLDGLEAQMTHLTLTFDVYLDTNSNPTTKVANNISADYFTPSGLLLNTEYYWKVVAKDPTGSSSSKDSKFPLQAFGRLLGI